jgi:hypothetical protein
MPHDLRQLFRAVGKFNGQRALTSSPPDRNEIDVPVEVLDEAAKITALPMDVAAWVDGIQASMVLTHRAHRPVYLSYVGAGAVDGERRPIADLWDLQIVCSHMDREWVDTLGTTIPVDEHAYDAPPDVEKAALQSLGGNRAVLEARLVDQLLEGDRSAADGMIVVDGALGLRTTNARMTGVVKSHGTKYLPDERVLYGLPAGWRSPRFKIPAGAAGGRSARYSTYVRLFNADHHAWAFGLIRLEAYTLDDLDALAARAMLERQTAASGDSRYDRHLRSIRACEEFLRSRRPSVYGL